MGNLEGTSSAVGQELTALYGFRSTVLSTAPAEDTRILGGLTSSSVDSGITVNLGAATTGVVVGDILRVFSGDFVVASGTSCFRSAIDPHDIYFTSALPRSFEVTGLALTAGPTPTLTVDREVFEPSHVGSFIHIWNTLGANRGTFEVLSFVDSKTVTIDNAAGLATTAAFSVNHIGVELSDKFSLTSGPAITDEYIEEAGLVGIASERRQIRTHDDLLAFTDEGWEIRHSARECVITTVGATSVVLGGAGLLENFTGLPWEIIRRADTTIDVESTLDWKDSGEIVIDGNIYSFTERTLTSLGGLSWKDETDSWYVGVKEAHEAAQEVVDFSQNFSKRDLGRRAVLIATAEGTDLSRLGQRLGLPRPVSLEDATYRELLTHTAYASRGLLSTLVTILDIVIGPGLYEIVEDMTVGSFNNGCRVYFARTDLNENPLGKSYLIHDELVPSTGAGTLNTALPPSTITIQNVQLAPDPRKPRRVIYESEPAGITASIKFGSIVQFSAPVTAAIQKGDIVIFANGLEVTITDVAALPASFRIASLDLGSTLEGSQLITLPRRVVASGSRAQRLTANTVRVFNAAALPTIGILSNARFELLSTTGSGQIAETGFISSRLADDTLQMASFLPITIPVVGQYNAWRVTNDLAQGISAVEMFFTVVRPISNFRYYLPTVEEYVEYYGAAATPVWSLVGAAVWALGTTPAGGPVMTLVTPGVSSSQFVHTLRIDRSVAAKFSLSFAVDSATISQVAGTANQFFMFIADGSRSVIAGIEKIVGTGFMRVGFCDAAGAFLNVSALAVLTFGASALITTGDKFTVIDTLGIPTDYIFEKDTTALVTVAGSVIINIITGDTPAAVRTKAVAAIQTAFGVPGAVSQIFATNGGGSDADLRQWYPGVLGNTTITVTQVGTGITVTTQFTGGVSESGHHPSVLGLIQDEEFVTLTIDRPENHLNVDRECALYLNGKLADVADYSAFDVTISKAISFGCSTVGALNAWVQAADWQTEDMIDRTNERWSTAVTTSPRTLTLATAFPGGKAAAKLRIKTFDTLNSSGGAPIGELQVDVLSSPNATTVTGVRQPDNLTVNASNRRYVRVNDDEPFIWPLMKGWSVQILTGVNAGTYPITSFLDESLTVPASFDAALPAMGNTANYLASEDDIVVVQRTALVELDTISAPGGLLAATTVKAAWRLVPAFATGGAVDFEFVNAVTVAGAAVTKAIDPWVHPSIYWVRRSVVPGFPEYVFDAFGFLRGIIDSFTVAGVEANFDDLIITDTGIHLLNSRRL